VGRRNGDEAHARFLRARPGLTDEKPVERRIGRVEDSDNDAVPLELALEGRARRRACSTRLGTEPKGDRAAAVVVTERPRVQVDEELDVLIREGL
jgi:hypothetical protein